MEAAGPPPTALDPAAVAAVPLLGVPPLLFADELLALFPIVTIGAHPVSPTAVVSYRGARDLRDNLTGAERVTLESGTLEQACLFRPLLGFHLRRCSAPAVVWWKRRTYGQGALASRGGLRFLDRSPGGSTTQGDMGRVGETRGGGQARLASASLTAVVLRGV